LEASPLGSNRGSTPLLMHVTQTSVHVVSFT
jgi:hypothetical protein